MAPAERMIVEDGDGALIRIVLPVRLKVRGGRHWLALPDGRAPTSRSNVDPVLVRGLSGAHGILAEMGVRPDGHAVKNRDVRGAASAYRRLIVTMAFLSPEIQAAIVAGRQPAGLKLEHLVRTGMPLAWADQKVKFGF